MSTRAWMRENLTPLLVANASIAGATPMFEWLGDDAAIFSY
jgi:hypothetical protein